MRRAWQAVLVLVLLEVPSQGGSVSSYFAARRDALMQKIEGIAVLQGAEEPRAYEQFRQSNDFYYLTGIEAPGAMLLIDAAQKRSVLFLPPRNLQLESWEGPRPGPDAETKSSSGFDEVLDVSRFEAEIEKAKTHSRNVYITFRPEETAQVSRDRAAQFELARERNHWDGRVSREKAFQEKLRQKLGDSIALRDLSPVLDDMRRVKDEQEIERLREAGRIGASGFIEAMRSAEPGRYEYQIADVAEFFFKWHGAMGPGFFAIAGSGPNSCILHYSANSRRTEAGDLFVLDFGPEYQYYQVDITRTFPVSGNFTSEQARVYGVVLEAYKAVLEKIRPGATFAVLNQAARSVVEREGFGKYWRHGVSHYVGMSTHDVGGWSPFEPGVVVSNEPGIYIPEKNIGIRIEDTVLVTSTGCEVLTSGVPKEMVEIERLMREKKRNYD